MQGLGLRLDSHRRDHQSKATGEIIRLGLGLVTGEIIKAKHDLLVDTIRVRVRDLLVDTSHSL